MRCYLLIAIVALAGCAGAPPLDNSESRATLEFTKPESGQNSTWYFASVDGHDLKRASTSIGIQPGRRTVGYYCSIVLDAPPPTTIQMNFEPHSQYIFHCTDQYHATVTAR